MLTHVHALTNYNNESTFA